MVKEYLDLILQGAEKVSSEDIVGIVKLSGVNPLVAGSLGAGAAGLGTYLAMKNDVANQKADADAKALLAGLAGTGLGYYLSSRNSTPSVQQYEYQSEPGELTVQDIYG